MVFQYKSKQIMKYKIIFIGILIVLSFNYCSKKAINSENNIGDIVIIFNNAPDHNMYTFPSGMKTGKLPKSLICYIDENNIQREYSPTKEIDTLIIHNSKNEYKEILHKFQGIEDIFYLFKNGDTIEFNYDSNLYPVAKSYISDNLSNQYNFQSNIKNRQVNFGFESHTLLNYGFIRKLNELKNEKPDIYNTVLKDYHIDFIDIDTLKHHFKTYKHNYKVLLDSLNNINIISKRYYNYYMYLFERKKMECLISDYDYLPENEDRKKLELKFLNFFNDSLIDNISYNRSVYRYMYSVLRDENEVTLIKETSGSHYDYRQIFDNLLHDRSLDSLPKTKELLYYGCLENIIEYFAKDDIQEYLSKYSELTHDSVKLTYLINKNHLEYTNCKDLLLLKVDGSQITFEEMLKKHKGKLVYVDFWASWCAPCLRSLPKARNLREKYKEKKVVFIYLAKDDENSSWSKTIEKFELNYLAENYFILNSKGSKMIEELEIKTIPRYLLFDRAGRLIHENAPGPGSDEIRNLFNTYLKE